MTALRTLLVDDEPPARHLLRHLLAQVSDVEVVAECGDAEAAVAALRRHAPDLLLLAVDLPVGDGFSVLEALGDARPPVVIFTAAHEGHAVRAFEVHAVDYLIKPFDDVRFFAALGRARKLIEQQRESAFGHRVQALLQAYESRTERAAPYLERLAIRDGGRVQFIKVEQVDWIEASGDYVCLHVEGRQHYLREKLGALAERLPPRRFARIHRSSIVNVDRIRELRGHDNGGYFVRLHGGPELKLSRGYQDEVLALLGRVA